MAALKAIEHVNKKSIFKCHKKVERLLIGEVEEELDAILDHSVYGHVKRKAKEKFGMNLNSAALKLLVQHTIETLKENPSMSLNEYLKRLGIKGRRIDQLLSISTLPIRVKSRQKHGKACRHLAYLIYYSVKEAVGERRG